MNLVATNLDNNIVLICMTFGLPEIWDNHKVLLIPNTLKTYLNKIIIRLSKPDNYE